MTPRSTGVNCSCLAMCTSVGPLSSSYAGSENRFVSFAFWLLIHIGSWSGCVPPCPRSAPRYRRSRSSVFAARAASTVSLLEQSQRLSPSGAVALQLPDSVCLASRATTAPVSLQEQSPRLSPSGAVACTTSGSSGRRALSSSEAIASIVFFRSNCWLSYGHRTPTSTSTSTTTY